MSHPEDRGSASPQLADSKPRVAIVIVNFNGGALLDKCLAALRRQTFNVLRVIVVDNASSDGSVDGIEQLYPEAAVIRLEAMASGLPVLCSNYSSLPEMASGVALLVEPEDVGAMTEGIRVLLEDEEWRSAAAKRALVVAAQYSWENTARDTVEVYRKVLGA